MAAIGALAAWLVWSSHRGETTTVITFVLFVALGELLEIPLERRDPFTLALAPALAFGFLRSCTETGDAWRCGPAPHLGEVLFVFLLGTMAATLVRAVRRRDLRLPRLARGTLVLLAGAGAYQVIVSLFPSTMTFGPSQVSAIGLLAVLGIVGSLELGLESAIDILTYARPPARAVRDEGRVIGPLLLSSVSVGALLSLAYPAFGRWTLPLFLAPLAATQFSFRQVATIRRNYIQTIRALSKVPEMAGYTVKGHSSRVARLAVEIGTELGAGDPELHEIEYAALLHDIGRVSLPDPQETMRPTAALELALVGAEIVENTGHFPRVATMVGRQHEPYRRRGEDTNDTLPVGAKIIKVASAYDDLTEPGGPGRTAWDALERLHLGMAYEYDPKVIQALTRVLERRGFM
jgi:putative nucleotidyltransferase with HDIG domain